MYSDICFFVKVVESGTVAIASIKLGLSTSTISRKIAILEKRLKNQLIQRGYQRISLTEYGQRIYKSFKEVGMEIDELIGQLRS